MVINRNAFFNYIFNKYFTIVRGFSGIVRYWPISWRPKFMIWATKFFPSVASWLLSKKVNFEPCGLCVCELINWVTVTIPIILIIVVCPLNALIECDGRWLREFVYSSCSRLQSVATYSKLLFSSALKSFPFGKSIRGYLLGNSLKEARI